MQNSYKLQSTLNSICIYIYKCTFFICLLVIYQLINHFPCGIHLFQNVSLTPPILHFLTQKINISLMWTDLQTTPIPRCLLRVDLKSLSVFPLKTNMYCKNAELQYSVQKNERFEHILCSLLPGVPRSPLLALYQTYIIGFFMRQSYKYFNEVSRYNLKIHLVPQINAS